ncbi:ferredoxin [Pelagibius sp. Alg239-R121]|uniref:ferredoxin n=1 Tax=Pelagibius sp. Alg239-R121 TaxID=2993448 RepID=UPI0024A6B21F|nr:ferredoxin [Pelagibius sp. Alg239-R121]
MQLEEIRQAAAQQGLLLRGGFHPDTDDTVPLLANGRRPSTILLLGNAGDGMWQAFRVSPEGQGDPGVPGQTSSDQTSSDQTSSDQTSADQDTAGALGPMDRWSLRVISALADNLNAEAAFPFGGPPYFPFQLWAQRSEPLWPSPLGVLIHQTHGLWHAYRGALCFDVRIDIPSATGETSPCETCLDQPCLSSCPVAAFSGNGYDVPACATHLATPAGADCMELGCRARRACPIGVSSRYEPEQAAFHMRAFLTARPKP